MNDTKFIIGYQEGSPKSKRGRNTYILNINNNFINTNAFNIKYFDTKEEAEKALAQIQTNKNLYITTSPIY